MSQSSDRPRRTVHAAATPRHCEQMAKKYGWKLRRAKPNGNPVLPVDCEFEGEAQFPNYLDTEDQ